MGREGQDTYRNDGDGQVDHFEDGCMVRARGIFKINTLHNESRINKNIKSCKMLR